METISIYKSSETDVHLDYGQTKKLGWVSSYARQVLLTRFLVRSISDFCDDPAPLDELTFLDIFRTIISMPQRPKSPGDYILAAPYTPTDKPTIFELKPRTSGAFKFSVYVDDPQYMDLTITSYDGSTSGGEYEFPGYDWMDQFLEEVTEAHTGTSLATKFIADSRVAAISNRPFWTTPPGKTYDLARGELLRLNSLNKGAWSFWLELYEGFLDGRTPDWSLWQDIALINDEHWKAGPEAVAREIEIRQAANDLDGKIDRFEAQLLQLASEPVFEGNRDNGGPPIEDHQARLATIQLIQAQLDVLKVEAEKAKPNSEEDPNPEVILTAIEKLKELVKKHFIIATVAATIGTTCVVNIVDSGFERYHVSEAFYETFEAIPSAATKLLEKLAQRPPTKSATSKSQVDSTPIDI